MTLNQNLSKRVNRSRKVAKAKPVNERNSLPDGNAPSESIERRTINLLDLVTEIESTTSLQLLRLTNDEVAFLPFTAETTEIFLHYCAEAEIQGYTRCQGKDCLLCKIGRQQDRRLLLPVYSPINTSISVLPISPSMRPHALLPQLINVFKTLREKQPRVVFLRREDNVKFSVSTSSLSPDADAGEAQIKRFLSEIDQGLLDITTIYPQINTDQLKAIPEILNMMKLKGIGG